MQLTGIYNQQTNGIPANAYITGVEGIGEVGTLLATGGALAEILGVEGTGQVGTLVATTTVFAYITGVSATGQVGELLANGGPPTLVSAEIRPDGVTLRTTWSQTLTTGSSTLGFSVTGTNIDNTPGFAANILDFVVPVVFPGAPAITISFNDAVGTLGGAGGDVVSFGPVAVTNNSALTGIWSQVGNRASWISSGTNRFGATSWGTTDIAAIENDGDSIFARRFDGTNWVTLGTSFTGMGTIAQPAICYMSGTNFAIRSGSSGNTWIRTVSFNGSTWSLVGTPLTLASVNSYSELCRLSDTRVVCADAQSDSFQAYDYDEGLGTWSTFGSARSISAAGNGMIRLAALSETLLAVAMSVDNTLELFSLSGGTWSAVAGSQISLGTGTNKYAICALNSTDVVVGNNASQVTVRRWSGSSWSTIGTLYTVPVVSSTNHNDMMYMGNNEVAFVSASGTNPFLTRLKWN